MCVWSCTHSRTILSLLLQLLWHWEAAPWAKIGSRRAKVQLYSVPRALPTSHPSAGWQPQPLHRPSGADRQAAGVEQLHRPFLPCRAVKQTICPPAGGSHEPCVPCRPFHISFVPQRELHGTAVPCRAAARDPLSCSTLCPCAEPHDSARWAGYCCTAAAQASGSRR